MFNPIREALRSEFRNLNARLDYIDRKLSTLIVKVHHMSQEMEVLKAAVEAENTVVDSAITLLNGLAAALAAAATDPAAVLALADEVNSKAAALAAAVAANTPAAPAVPA